MKIKIAKKILDFDSFINILHLKLFYNIITISNKSTIELFINKENVKDMLEIKELQKEIFYFIDNYLSKEGFINYKKDDFKEILEKIDESELIFFIKLKDYIPILNIKKIIYYMNNNEDRNNLITFYKNFYISFYLLYLINRDFFDFINSKRINKIDINFKEFNYNNYKQILENSNFRSYLINLLEDNIKIKDFIYYLNIFVSIFKEKNIKGIEDYHNNLKKIIPFLKFLYKYNKRIVDYLFNKNNKDNKEFKNYKNIKIYKINDNKEFVKDIENLKVDVDKFINQNI